MIKEVVNLVGSAFARTIGALNFPVVSQYFETRFMSSFTSKDCHTTFVTVVSFVG